MQCPQDRALAAFTTGAAGDGSFKFTGDAPQFAHALLDVGKVMPGELVDVAARQRRIVCQCEQTTNLLQAEPECATARDEPQPVDLLRPVSAISARGSRRAGQQSNAFVIANRLDVAVTGRRCFADLHDLTL